MKQLFTRDRNHCPARSWTNNWPHVEISGQRSLSKHSY